MNWFGIHYSESTLRVQCIHSKFQSTECNATGRGRLSYFIVLFYFCGSDITFVQAKKLPTESIIFDYKFRGNFILLVSGRYIWGQRVFIYIFWFHCLFRATIKLYSKLKGDGFILYFILIFGCFLLSERIITGVVYWGNFVGIYCRAEKVL